MVVEGATEGRVSGESTAGRRGGVLKVTRSVSREKKVTFHEIYDTVAEFLVLF